MWRGRCRAAWASPLNLQPQKKHNIWKKPLCTWYSGFFHCEKLGFRAGVSTEWRISGVGFRWCAAPRLRTWCTNPRKTLFFRFLCTKSLALFGAPTLRSTNPLDLVQRLPQNLVPSFPLHQVFEFQFSVYDVTWCFAPRNPLFLRPEAPRPQVRMSLCRHGRGASLPAIPYSFVEGHHVPGPGWDWKRKCGRICHSTALPSTSVLYRQKK